MKSDSQPFLCQHVDEITDSQFKSVSTDFGRFLRAKLKTNPTQIASSNKVLMLTRRHDAESDFVGIEMVRRGIDYFRINVEDIPMYVLLTCLFEKGSVPRLGVGINGDYFDPSTVKLVWLRHFEPRLIHFRGTKLSRIFAAQQWEDGLLIMQSQLRCHWINNPEATSRMKSNRIEQLSVAEDTGFEVPDTLVTNDVSRAREFYDIHYGKIIIKALHHHGIEIGNKVYSMYTRGVIKSDLPKLTSLVYAPCILQQRIEKSTELRATVVGDKVFLVELDSKSNPMGRDDWHRGQPKYIKKKKIKPTDRLASNCIGLVRKLGLEYGTLDLIVDGDKKTYFLEVNPTGDWHWLGENVRSEIVDAMVDLIESKKSG